MTTEPRQSRWNWHPLWQLLANRLREFFREPAAVFWVYVFPLIMTVALGVAFRERAVERVDVLIESGPEARNTLEALAGDERIAASIASAEQCRQQLRTGKADLIVSVEQSSSKKYQYAYDPTRPGSVLARNTTDDRLQRAAGRNDPVPTSDQEIDEPGGRYIDFLVPGLLGMGLMGGGLWGVGFAIVDMRIRKLLKRFIATPMRRTDFLLSIMLSRLVFMVPEVLLLLVFARVAFGVVNQGSYTAVILLLVIGAFEFAGIGLLVASRARTLETVSGLMNLIMLPLWIGSGIFFSVERFPEVVQPALKLLPLTPLIDALRAVMLEGQSLAMLGPELAMICVWGVITFFAGLWLFRWN